MPARAPLSFSAGQQQTPEESHRSRDHSIMMACCVLATVFGLVTTGLSIYLGWVIFQLNAASYLLSVIGLVMTAVGACGIAASTQNAKHLKATQAPAMFIYIYGVILLTPVILLVMVGCFSFDSTLTSFVRHGWDDGSADELRVQFCPGGTADRQCRAPVLGGPDFDTVDAWCTAGCPYEGRAGGALLCAYNTTGCEWLVDSAQDDAREWISDMANVTGSLSLFNVTLLIIGATFAIRLLTVQVFMKSMLSVINAESLPFCVMSTLSGTYALHRQYFVGGLVWVAWMFIAVGAICATLAAIGFYAGHFKIRRLLGVYNACVVLVLVVCSVVSVTCWVLTGELDNHFEDMTPADIQDIPCRANFEGCCCCGEDTEEVCPEWSKNEIMDFISLILKLLGFVSFFVGFFLGFGFLGAIAWYKSLEEYQCEMV
mmetsp:Transcript_13218/g.21639  ORF Transcript_13218/g.21639 Transcript_13218/m.21639 type:complete len:429 (-) Transcript_13218:81-1367(-)